jgi:hypothetical protein
MDLPAVAEKDRFLIWKKDQRYGKVKIRRQERCENTLRTPPVLWEVRRDQPGSFACSCIPNGSNFLFIIGISKATVAQSAEHLTRNEDVRGSIPRGGSICFQWPSKVPFRLLGRRLRSKPLCRSFRRRTQRQSNVPYLFDLYVRPLHMISLKL